MSSSVRSEGLDNFSLFIGWCYFIAWSISFWPQTILNYRRKSVSGLSFDFQLYNLTGFTFYTIYTIYKYVEDANAGAQQSVFSNDIAFGVHAVIMSCVVIWQFYAYDSQGAKPASKIHTAIISILWILAVYTLLLVLTNSLEIYCPPVANNTCGSRLTLIDYLGYGKAVISFVKYTPQAWFNFQRKSTAGWSIINILLDLTGGSLSFLQQFIDAYNYDDGTIIWGNIPKLLLAIESIGFDILFMVQHYVLYKDRREIVSSTIDDNLLLKDSLKSDQSNIELNGSHGHQDNNNDNVSVSDYQSDGASEPINDRHQTSNQV